MSFLPFEDVPLYLSCKDNSGEFIFAESASISVSQPVNSFRQADDNIFPILCFGEGSSEDIGNNVITIYDEGDANAPEDATLTNEIFYVTLGPSGGPPQPVATSIEEIPQDTEVIFPSGSGESTISLFVAREIIPNGHDYIVPVYAKNPCTLSGSMIQSGIFQPNYKYHAVGPIEGQLDVSFYFNTGNLDPFFNITGRTTLFNPDDKISGYLGPFRFDNAYLNNLSFSLSPNSISQASANFTFYGSLIKDESIITGYFQNGTGYLYEQQSIPHGQNSQIIATNNLGVNHPIAFSYNMNIERSAKYSIPSTSDYIDLNDLTFLIPEKVSTRKITTSATIAGDSINPLLIENTLSPHMASISVDLYDLNYEDQSSDVFYERNDKGKLKTFTVTGFIGNQNLSVNSAGYLAGEVSVTQVIE